MQDAFNAAIDELALKSTVAQNKGEKKTFTLKLEKKTYRLSGTINMTGAKNLTIEGNGATLVWSQPVTGFHMQECSNVTFKNLNLDFDPMVYTQGTVTAKSGSTITLRVDKGFSDSASWLTDSKNRYGMVFDAKTNAPKAGYSHTYAFSSVTKTGSMTLSATINFGTANGVPTPEVGDKLSIFRWAGPAMFIAQDCEKTAYRNINLYQSPGSAVSETSGKGGSVMDHFNVVPGPDVSGTKRCMSIMSDAFHFGNVEKGPTMTNCTISNCADDGVNVQGFFFHVLKVSGNKITVTPKWDTPLAAGETIEGYKASGYDSLGTAKVVKFEKRNDSSMRAQIKAAYAGMDGTLQDDTLVYDIVLDKKLSIAKSDHITSLNRIGSGTTIKNCTFKNNRARGVVVKGHDIVIENNTFSGNTHPAIAAHADLYWCESAFPVNVKIRGNKITNNAVSGEMYKQPENDMIGSIFIGVTPPQGTNGFYNCKQNKNILIENNTITNTNVYGIMAANCDGVTIQKNTVTNPFQSGIGTVGQRFGVTPDSGILVAGSTNITVSGNTVSGNQISQAVALYECTNVKANANNNKK